MLTIYSCTCSIALPCEIVFHIFVGLYCVTKNLISGLFHRAILMSGSALSDWAVVKHPTPATMQVIQGINCPLSDDNEEIVQCLRKKR